MKFTSIFRVIHQNRNSKARYVRDVQVGDVIKVEMNLRSTTGASNGNYALYFSLFRQVDGEFEPVAYANGVSQNELPKGFSADPDNLYSVFTVEQLD